MDSFKFAGVSRHNNKTKVRLANDQMRIKVLVKGGHEDVNLLELPNEMTKPEVVTYLKTTSLMENTVFRQAIEEADEKYNGSATVQTKAPKAAKTPKAAKETKAPKVKKSAEDTMKDLQARVAAAAEAAPE